MNRQGGGGGKQTFAMDYIDVATRIAEFRSKHPDGALQPADRSVPYRVEQIGGEIYIVVVAAAYRSPDDAKPGIGMAYEPFPGRTPYTKGSELQNAETSAWGRAIVAALAGDTRQGIASAEDVRNRVAEREERTPTPQPSRKEAAQIALLATQTADVERLRRTLAAANENGTAALDVADALTAAARAAAGVPAEGTVTLREWLTACGKHVKAHGSTVESAGTVPPV
jgi:hypothetical protein